MLRLRSQVARYVLLFEGRTGSSYITSALQNDRRVRAEGEILPRLKKDGHEAQAEKIRTMLTPPLLGRYAAVGFKTKLRDIANPPRFGDLLREVGVRVIHMQRRNRVKTAISEVNSNILKQRTQRFQIYSEEERLPALEIPLGDFRYALALRERLDGELATFVEQLGCPHLDIHYEDLLLDEPGLFRRIYEFLGMEPAPVRGETLKNTSDDLRHSVLNLDELKAAYAGTRYEPMFDEVLVRDR